jgi:nicotinamide-nucleotide amidase
MLRIKDLLSQEPPLTIAVAESLTCGRLQQRLGDLPSASGFFLGGITCYALEQKTQQLGVEPQEAQEVGGIPQATLL